MTSPFRDELSIAYEKIARLEKEAETLRRELPFVKRLLLTKRPKWLVRTVVVLGTLSFIPLMWFFAAFSRMILVWHPEATDSVARSAKVASRK